MAYMNTVFTCWPVWVKTVIGKCEDNIGKGLPHIIVNCKNIAPQSPPAPVHLILYSHCIYLELPPSKLLIFFFPNLLDFWLGFVSWFDLNQYFNNMRLILSSLNFSMCSYWSRKCWTSAQLCFTDKTRKPSVMAYIWNLSHCLGIWTLGSHMVVLLEGGRILGA